MRESKKKAAMCLHEWSKNMAAMCLHEQGKNMAAMCLHEWSKNNSDALVRGLAGTNTKKPPEPMMTQAVLNRALLGLLT